MRLGVLAMAQLPMSVLAVREVLSVASWLVF